MKAIADRSHREIELDLWTRSPGKMRGKMPRPVAYAPPPTFAVQELPSNDDSIVYEPPW